MFIIKKNDFADFELIEIEIDRNISVTTTSSQLFSWSLILVLPSVFNGDIKEIFLVSMIL